MHLPGDDLKRPAVEQKDAVAEGEAMGLGRRAAKPAGGGHKQYGGKEQFPGHEWPF